MHKRNMQKQKMHEERLRFIQELRRSSAASPIASAKQYKRKPKHKSQMLD